MFLLRVLLLRFKPELSASEDASEWRPAETALLPPMVTAVLFFLKSLFGLVGTVFLIAGSTTSLVPVIETTDLLELAIAYCWSAFEAPPLLIIGDLLTCSRLVRLILAISS